MPTEETELTFDDVIALVEYFALKKFGKAKTTIDGYDLDGGLSEAEEAALAPAKTAVMEAKDTLAQIEVMKHEHEERIARRAFVGSMQTSVEIFESLQQKVVDTWNDWQSASGVPESVRHRAPGAIEEQLVSLSTILQALAESARALGWSKVPGKPG